MDLDLILELVDHPILQQLVLEKCLNGHHLVRFLASTLVYTPKSTTAKLRPHLKVIDAPLPPIVTKGACALRTTGSGGGRCGALVLTGHGSGRGGDMLVIA